VRFDVVNHLGRDYPRQAHDTVGLGLAVSLPELLPAVGAIPLVMGWPVTVALDH
jgi:hypothetical protein